MLSFWEGRVCPFFIKIHFFVMMKKSVESVEKTGLGNRKDISKNKVKIIQFRHFNKKTSKTGKKYA